MNSRQVKDRLRNISKEKNIDINILLKFYVFDRFIIRLSKSAYKDNFIIKGGFLLSQFFGLNDRVTADIDSLLKKNDLSKKNILEIVTDIINVDLNDEVKFSIRGIEQIRNEDEYGGYRINLSFKFDNIRETLKFDIATGDPITPKEISFNYITLLDNEKVKILSYNIETILAEKLETILSKLEVSSRMKDYYDIYLIYHKNWNILDKSIFIEACQNTFAYRHFSLSISEAFEVIRNSRIIKKRWKEYTKKYSYAREIEFDSILVCLDEIIESLKTFV